MAFFKVGTFVKSNAVGTQVIPHTLGLVPKAIMVWGSTAISDTEIAGSGFGLGIGAGATLSVGASLAFTSGDALATTSAFRDLSSNSTALSLINSSGVAIVRGQVTSPTAADFSISWTTNNAAAYRFHYIVMGGSWLQAKTGLPVFPTAATKIVTGVGFSPDVFLEMSIATSLSNTTHGMFSMGAGDKALNQWAISHNTDSGGAVANSARGQMTDAVMSKISGASFYKTTLTSVDVDGWTLSDVGPSTFNGANHAYLALKGGKSRVGKTNKTAVAATTVVTGLGFQPAAVILMSVQSDTMPSNPPNTSSPNLPGGAFMVGASDGTNHACTATFDIDNVTPSDTFAVDRQNAAYIALSGHTITDVGTVTMNADGFTINWSTSTTAQEVLYMALGGPTPPTATGLTVSDTTSGTPRIAWTFADADAGDTQTAKQVQILNDTTLAVILDTGKLVSTTQFYDVLYANKLAPNVPHRAQVMVWDSTDTASVFSTPVVWTTPKAYQASGTYTTEVLNPATTATGTLTWTAVVPADTTFTGEYRTSADNVTWGAWTAIANGGALPASNYVQARFNLATTYGLASPELQFMKLQYTGSYYATGTWTGESLAMTEFHSGTATWTDTIPAGTSLSVEYRTAPANAWVPIAKGGAVPWSATLQLRATLNASSDLQLTPRITDLTISGLAKYKASGTWAGPQLNLINDTPTSGTVTWVETLNGGTVSVETRSSMDGQTWGGWTAVAASGAQIPTLTELYLQGRITVSRNAGGNLSPVVSRFTFTVTNADPRGTWLSQAVDISQTTSKASGKLVLTLKSNGDTVTRFYRYSTDNTVTWSSWLLVEAGGGMAGVPANAGHVQVLLVVNGQAEVQTALLTFDGSATTTLITNTLAANSDYDFTQLKDNLIIVNGNDAPMKWDVTTFAPVGGTPPIMSIVETHLNRVWGVEKDNPSRVRWSDTLNFESWPVLNFIDFNPEDGSQITALYKAGSNLLIGKEHSAAIISGDRDSNFSVLWLDSHERGPVGPRSVTSIDRYIAYVATDGIRLSDLTKSTLHSVKLVKSWEKEINHRRLNQAAVVYWNQYLLITLPSTNSLTNDTVWVYDTIRNAWARIVGWNVSCWLKFPQFGEEILLAGDSVTGQVYQVLTGDKDDNQTVELDWQSGNIDMEYPERYKLFGNHTVTVEGKPGPQTLRVYYDVIGGTDPNTGEFVDGEQTFVVDPITVPAGDEVTHIYRILPPVWGAVLGRAISIRLLTGANIHSMTLDITVRGIVPGGL